MRNYVLELSEGTIKNMMSVQTFKQHKNPFNAMILLS